MNNFSQEKLLKISRLEQSKQRNVVTALVMLIQCTKNGILKPSNTPLIYQKWYIEIAICS